MKLQHFFQSLWGIVNEMSPYILLGFILAGVLHVFIKPSAMSRHLSGRGFGPVLKAALFGIPLPLCSCGVLPTAVALRRQGASKGATTSFLIATPQTGVDSIAATYSLLGLPFAILRPVAALVGSVFGGWTVSRVADDKDTPVASTVEHDGCDDPSCSCHGGEESCTCHDGCGCAANVETYEYAGMSFGRKMLASLRYGLVDMVASVGKWLVIGLVVAALITVLVPDELFLSLSARPLLAMLVMILVAVPMYVCATGSIPIALSLMLKGLTPGVGFVLLMAGPAANFASVMILSRTMGRRATVIYVASVVVTAIGFGLIIDYLMPASWFVPSISHAASCHGHGEVAWFPTVCSVILAALLAYTTFLSRTGRLNGSHGHSHNHDHNHSNIDKTVTIMKKEYHVTGMNCAHCQATVLKALSALDGAENVTVDLPTGIAVVEGDVDPEAVRQAVYNAGFNLA
ncbi:MAG: SO_0444 family Cu/Zn efflux transporter [Paenibacillus sp.]|nr:SO_0444 family Cu/Zn efflux transporter [Paenibacillus sp.]